jgi:hypothetical protein
MLTAIPKKRPDCEEILIRVDKWLLSMNEFDINNTLRNIIISKDNNFKLIYSMLRYKSSLQSFINTYINLFSHKIF